MISSTKVAGIDSELFGVDRGVRWLYLISTAFQCIYRKWNKERMWDMAYVNSTHIPPPPILTFVFSLVSPTGSAGSEQDKYQLEDRESLYNCVHDL